MRHLRKGGEGVRGGRLDRILWTSRWLARLEGGRRGITGWALPTSLRRWMPRTSVRIFLLVVEGADSINVDWRSLARGCADRESESTDISSADASAEEWLEAFDARRGFCFSRSIEAEGLAHSGTGYNRSNCWRRRFVYSLPFTKSSASVLRSFRSRELDANDTTRRSSSLSTHAGALSPCRVTSSSSEVGTPMRSALRTVDGLASRKNSFVNISL